VFRWVVPYNPYLSQKYNAHINVEVCATVSSIKYVYKYVYKGHDRANIAVESENEVSKYIDARYVSATEASWRLFSFSMHEEHPAHQRLAIHLPNQQPVYFSEDANPLEVIRRDTRNTTLMGWFEYNRLNVESRKYLYVEFPEHYVWVPEKKMWKIREMGDAIGRVYAISPKNSEAYHLRILLHHVRGAKCFEELRTVDGVEYGTFKEAAAAMNLLQSDLEWDKCISEASSYQMPSALRSLFSIILIHCLPTDPYKLWTDHRNSLVEDYSNRFDDSKSYGFNLNVI